MKYKFAIILSIFLISCMGIVSATVALKFTWQPTSTQIDAYKGSTASIGLKITNQETVPISCQVRTASQTVGTLTLPGNSYTTTSFTYNVPYKINNLQDTSYSITVDCGGTVATKCNVLDIFYSCTENRYFSLPLSVQLHFKLTAQDQANKANLESYHSVMSSVITTLDSNTQTLLDLVSQTASPLLPPQAQAKSQSNRQSFNQLYATFSNVQNSIDSENYDLGLSIYSSSDSAQAQSVNSDSIQVISQIRANVAKFNEILNAFTNSANDATKKVLALNYDFNKDLVSQLDELGKDTKTKLTGYQFADLNDASAIANSYGTQKDKILNQMQSNLQTYYTKALSPFIIDMNNICTKFSICDTNSKYSSQSLESSSDFKNLCSAVSSLTQEIYVFNERETTTYDTALSQLKDKNEAIRKQNTEIQKNISSIQELNSRKLILNGKVNETNKKLFDAVKNANSIGKEINFTQFIEATIEFNNLSLKDKEAKAANLDVYIFNITSQANDFANSEGSVSKFFKKIFYFVFGSNQAIPAILESEKLEQLPTLLDEIKNNITLPRTAEVSAETKQLLAQYCKQTGQLSDVTANNLVISTENKASSIKTSLQEAQKSCIDENGQRTTECCDSDDYKSRTDLYPVIFVHGHAFETDDGDVQSSLSAFDYMSRYFASNGYVQKDILYPESAKDIIKGSWAFCKKPVAIRVTYYTGLQTGATHQYQSSIADYAPTLKTEIEAVLKATNKDKAIIVAHSMGGIISRYYIKNDGGKSEVQKLITIGTPHYGVRTLAAFGSNFGSTESSQMVSTSDFLKELNNPSDSLVPSYTISGNDKSCILEDCDGVVYVKSSQLNSSTQSKIFTGDAYSHSGMLVQQDVAQQVLSWAKS